MTIENNSTNTYRETFTSPAELETRGDAYLVLDKIRAAHPAESGWVEIDGYVDELSNGKFRAVRVHEKRK